MKKHQVTSLQTHAGEARRPAAAGGSYSLLATRYSLLLLSVLCLLSPGVLRAQYETQLTTLIDPANPNPAYRFPLVLEAPYPFVEVSRILRDDFAKRRADSLTFVPPSRLLAWFIPTLSLKNQLNEKTDRYRSLMVQVLKELEPVRYTPDDFKKFQADSVPRGVAVIGEEDVDTVFHLLNLGDFEKKAGGQKLLGVTNLGPDSFTLCIAQSIEGRDQLGGRAIQASISCATYILINQKILLLNVTGIELSAAELGNTMRLTREWIHLLRKANKME